MVVRLRKEPDVAAIAAASHDPETRRWLTDGPMDDEARRTSMARVEEAWRSGKSAPLVIADAGTDEPVGLINLQFGDSTTVAYSVFPAHRGGGIAPRALRLVSDWAFAGLGLNRLLLEADEANAASLRVAEKCQFQRISSRVETDAEQGSRTTVTYARWRS